MDCDFSPSSPHLLPNGLFSPQNQISFELLALSGLSGFSTFKGGKMLIFQGFANSRIVREFPPFSFKVRIATPTRNALGQETVAWVRLPPSAPKAAPCGVLFSVFIASFARWDSNSPCPALCVPPGCNNPVGCCKGAGTPTICTISAVESKYFAADALGGFSGATIPSSVGESKKDYIVKRPSGIMKVRSANCTNKIPGGL